MNNWILFLPLFHVSHHNCDVCCARGTNNIYAFIDVHRLWAIYLKLSAMSIYRNKQKNDDDTFPGYGLNGHDSHNVLSIEHQSMMHFGYFFSCSFFSVFLLLSHFSASPSFIGFVFILQLLLNFSGSRDYFQVMIVSQS